MMRQSRRYSDKMFTVNHAVLSLCVCNVRCRGAEKRRSKEMEAVRVGSRFAPGRRNK